MTKNPTLSMVFICSPSKSYFLLLLLLLPLLLGWEWDGWLTHFVLLCSPPPSSSSSQRIRRRTPSPPSSQCRLCVNSGRSGSTARKEEGGGGGKALGRIWWRLSGTSCLSESGGSFTVVVRRLSWMQKKNVDTNQSSSVSVQL